MNLENAHQRIRWFTFAVLAGLAIILTILDNTGNLDPVFTFVRNPMSIMLEWTAGRADILSSAIAGPRDLQAAQAEIAALQAHIEALERENEQLRELQGEYQILLDLVNRARQTPELRRVTASVIGYDPSPAMRSIIIDKGSADGVQVGMPVESARGLVGQVFRTTNRVSQVALLTDSSSRIPIRLGTSRATGILSGGGVGRITRIDWIDLRYQVEVGELVLSSGLGGKFPEGIPVGRVVEVQRREAELFQRATVQPAVDFQSLEMVFVIIDFQPVDAELFTGSPGE